MMSDDKIDAAFPLRGIRVLEIGDFIGVPYCTRLLADAGADVVKVESTNGDSARLEGPFPEDVVDPEHSAMFAFLNRGKRSVMLDIESKIDRENVLNLIAQADVVVHGFHSLKDSPLAITREELQAAYPSLIVTSLTPFGETGPFAKYRSDDLITVSMSGLAYATPGVPDSAIDAEAEPPLRVNAYIGEFVGGAMAAAGAMLAVLGRQVTGRGDFVEVSKQEALACMLIWNQSHYSYAGIIVGRNPVRGRLMPNVYLPCADGWVAMVAFLENHWASLVKLMGNPEWVESGPFSTGIDRGENWEELEPLLLSWLVEQPGSDLFRQAQEAGIPICHAQTVAEAVENEHAQARQYMVPSGIPGDNRGKLPGSIYTINGRRRATNIVVPRLGEHTKHVLSEWLGDRRTRSVSNASSRVMGGRGSEDVRPMDGIRIVDFGQIVAGPLAGQWPAIMGAEVILVESSAHLPSRGFAPFAGDPPHNTSGIFNFINRNKLSCTLNLNTPEGVDLAKRLVATADVVQENFSPGTMEKLGLSYDALKAVKPDIIMLSLSACGSTGPWQRYSALHSGVILMSGLASVTGYESGYPRMVGSILPDPAAAMYGMIGVMQAIYHKRRTGEGQHIEIAMTEILQSFMADSIAEYTMLGREPELLGNGHKRKVPHNIYRTKGEDSWVAISVDGTDEWEALCNIIGRPELSRDPRFLDQEARMANRDKLDACITEWTLNKDAWEITSQLQHSGVVAGPAYNSKDILEDEHLKTRGFIVDDDHPTTGRRLMTGLPWGFKNIPPPVYRHAPLLAAHNEYVFKEVLALSENEIQDLVNRKVIH
jgi:crotonobetainyl-CoA:carnitine CoA-transferase CaiB-like acyl-CoA transferase